LRNCDTFNLFHSVSENVYLRRHRHVDYITQTCVSRG